MAITVEELKNDEVSASVVAAALGISVQRVYHLVEDGILTVCSPKGKPRKFKLPDVIQAYVAYKEGGSKTKAEKTQLEDLKKKKLIADTALRNSQRELHEMKTKLFEGKLLEVDEVEESYKHFFKVLKRLIGAIPPRVAGEVSGYITDPVEVRKIEQEIQEDLNQTITSFIDSAKVREREAQ